MSRAVDYRQPPILERCRSVLAVSGPEDRDWLLSCLGYVEGIEASWSEWPDMNAEQRTAIEPPEPESVAVTSRAIVCLVLPKTGLKAQNVKRAIRHFDPGGRASIVVLGAKPLEESKYLRAGAHHLIAATPRSLMALVVSILKLLARRRAVERYERNRARHYLAYMLSHEINNSLAICQPLVPMLRQFVQAVESSDEEEIEDIFTDLDDGMLRLKKVSAMFSSHISGFSAESGVIDVEGVRSLVSECFRSTSLEYQFECHSAMHGRRYMLSKNLFVRAVQEMLYECSTVAVGSIRIDLVAYDGYVCFRVGMQTHSDADPDSLMEPNYRVEGGVVRYSRNLSSVDALVTDAGGCMFSIERNGCWFFTLQMPALWMERPDHVSSEIAAS